MAEQGNKLSLPPSHIRYYMDSSSLFLSAVGSKLSMTFNGHSVQHCDRVAANQISLSSLANRSAAPCLQCPLNTPLVSFQLYLEAIFAAWTKLSCEQDTLEQAGKGGPVEPGFSRQRVVLPTSHVEQSAWWCVCVYKLYVYVHMSRQPPLSPQQRSPWLSADNYKLAFRRSYQTGKYYSRLSSGKSLLILNSNNQSLQGYVSRCDRQHGNGGM